MLSIIILAKDDEALVVATLGALVSGAAAGIVTDVILVDRGQSDTIVRIADVAGCNYLAATGGRAEAFSKGSAATRSPWLLFLDSGSILDQGWLDEAVQFIQTSARGLPRTARFREASSPFESFSIRDAVIGWIKRQVRPASANGVLIARAHYLAVGGFVDGQSYTERSLLSRSGRSVILRTRLFVQNDQAAT